MAWQVGGYALITDMVRLRRLVNAAAPIASKLLRLLPGIINPGAATTSMCRGTRQRTEADGHDDGERVRVVRVRHAGDVWSHTLDWDEIALVREPTPGRDPSAAWDMVSSEYLCRG